MILVSIRLFHRGREVWNARDKPSLPWRRANVRHRSNELYADVVETLIVTLGPSGRLLAALFRD